MPTIDFTRTVSRPEPRSIRQFPRGFQGISRRLFIWCQGRSEIPRGNRKSRKQSPPGPVNNRVAVLPIMARFLLMCVRIEKYRQDATADDSQDRRGFRIQTARPYKRWAGNSSYNAGAAAISAVSIRVVERRQQSQLYR